MVTRARRPIPGTDRRRGMLDAGIRRRVRGGHAPSTGTAIDAGEAASPEAGAALPDDAASSQPTAEPELASPGR